MAETRYCGYCRKMITDEDQAYYHKPWYTWYCSLDHAVADGALEDDDGYYDYDDDDYDDYDYDYDDYYDDEDEDDYDYDDYD